MKNSLLIIPITIALAIFFFPTTSNSNATGSPGGKTGSPADIGNCMGCHIDAQQGQGGMITTNIPSTGYEPGLTYNITVAIPNIGVGVPPTGPQGFELTCEENATNTKTGLFGITNPTSTKFTNNSSAVTHTTAGNSMNTWELNWVAPIAGTGNITFYGAFIEASYPIGNNQGDLFNEAMLSFDEAEVNSTINFSQGDDFTFNSVSQTIESNTTISVYDVSGRIVLTTNSYSTNISHLNPGTYIFKSDKKSQKFILN